MANSRSQSSMTTVDRVVLSAEKILGILHELKPFERKLVLDMASDPTIALSGSKNGMGMDLGFDLPKLPFLPEERTSKQLFPLNKKSKI